MKENFTKDEDLLKLVPTPHQSALLGCWGNQGSYFYNSSTNINLYSNLVLKHSLIATITLKPYRRPHRDSEFDSWKTRWITKDCTENHVWINLIRERKHTITIKKMSLVPSSCMMRGISMFEFVITGDKSPLPPANQLSHFRLELQTILRESYNHLVESLYISGTIKTLC